MPHLKKKMMFLAPFVVGRGSCDIALNNQSQVNGTENKVAKVEPFMSRELKWSWKTIKKFVLYMSHPACVSMNF